MAIGIQSYNGTVTAPDSDYPDGNIKDDSGALDGTDIDVKSNGDIQQAFAKLMRMASITPNGLPDNEYNGFQFLEAMEAIYGDHRQKVIITGIAASQLVYGNFNPDVIVLEDTVAGHIISLNISGAPLIGKVRIANYSFSPISVVSATGETINSAASPFTMASRSVIEFQFDNGTNWSVINRFIMP